MRHQTATALDGEDQLISQAIVTVARRLFADFQPAVSMPEVLMTILQCRHDLDTDPMAHSPNSND
jgi:hypothetical protein